MPDTVQIRGRDTFVVSAHPDADRSEASYLRLTSGAAKIFLHMPMPGIRGRTIGLATLTAPVYGSWAAQTLTATPVAADWGPRKTTWNKQPALRSTQIATAAQGAKTDGQRVELNVTSFVQSIADGKANWGWCITTNSSADNRVRGFDAPGDDSWVLSIDFSDAPEAPTDLRPAGNAVSGEPTITFDFTDLGGTSTELATVRVQVNTSASASGAWDSGHVDTNGVPEFDLAASAWPVTPVAGTRYYYRVFVKDGAGLESDPSDWASFVYAPKPTLTIDNPSGGLAWDPTPTIAAHISSGEIKVWRIRVSKGNDKSKVLYDSGRQGGDGDASIAHTIPFRNEDGRRILKDDSTYWVGVRIWDRNDREASPGDPVWTETWAQFVLDDDATPTPPSSLTAEQVGDTPRVELTWVRSTGFPEGWVILRDGEVIARLDPDEVDVSGSTYTWVDTGAAPFIEHIWKVKAIDGGKQSEPSPTSTLTTAAEGVWLLSDHGDVMLRGVDLTGLTKTDKRATYSPIGTPYDVDVVYALGGIAGTYTGTISNSRGYAWEAARDALEAMREEPDTEVQLVFSTVSVPVKLADVAVLPSPSMHAGNMLHEVSFTAKQTSHF